MHYDLILWLCLFPVSFSLARAIEDRWCNPAPLDAEGQRVLAIFLLTTYYGVALFLATH
jgi:hypothetical protein